MSMEVSGEGVTCPGDFFPPAGTERNKSLADRAENAELFFILWRV